jgi:hypothetical protein
MAPNSPTILDSIFLGHHDLHLNQPGIRVAGQPIEISFSHLLSF